MSAAGARGGTAGARAELVLRPGPLADGLGVLRPRGLREGVRGLALLRVLHASPALELPVTSRQRRPGQELRGPPYGRGWGRAGVSQPALSSRRSMFRCSAMSESYLVPCCCLPVHSCAGPAKAPRLVTCSGRRAPGLSLLLLYLMRSIISPAAAGMAGAVQTFMRCCRKRAGVCEHHADTVGNKGGAVMFMGGRSDVSCTDSACTLQGRHATVSAQLVAWL